MKKLLIGCLLSAATLMAVPAPVSATGNEKVTICHRTNSETNPYVMITVSKKAVDGEGKNDHTHHVADEQHPRGDIIPAPEGGCPDATDEPVLVLVCLNGFVASIPAEIAAELDLEILGDDAKQGDKCDEPEPVIVEKEVVKVVEKIVEVPGPTQVMTVTREVPAPAAPAAPVQAPTGELPRTGGSAGLLWIGSGVTALGLFLRRLFR